MTRLSRRRELNRANARKSRQRKKQYFDQLEGRLREVEAEAATLREYLRTVVLVHPDAVLAGSAPTSHRDLGLVASSVLSGSSGSTASAGSAMSLSGSSGDDSPTESTV